MEIIFGFFALIVLGAIIVGSVMLLLFMARKMGLINADTTDNIKGFKIPYLETVGQSLITRFALVALLSVLMSIPLSMVDNAPPSYCQKHSTSTANCRAMNALVASINHWFTALIYR